MSDLEHDQPNCKSHLIGYYTENLHRLCTMRLKSTAANQMMCLLSIDLVADLR